MQDIEIKVLRFLRDMSTRLSNVAQPENALRFGVRGARDLFGADLACLASVPPGEALAELDFVVPQGSVSDQALVTAYLHGQKPMIPPGVVMERIPRWGRTWAAIVLHRDGRPFSKTERRGLTDIARRLADRISRLDDKRVQEVRSRIDKKIMEQLRPRDLFYQILHGLRDLTRYDHSSALFVSRDSGHSLELVAEQITCAKCKSFRIGMRLPLPETLSEILDTPEPVGLQRRDGRWTDLVGRDAGELADRLKYSCPQDDTRAMPREAGMLCVPIATRKGLIGLLKLAWCDPDGFGDYEQGLLGQFTTQISVAIQYLKKMESLERSILEAEKKRVVADLMRGVSHDINHAMGAVLPLVQQMREDVRNGDIDSELFGEDLLQVEQSLNVCRRIFGGMLDFAHPKGRKVGQGNLRRAIENTQTVLRNDLERRNISVDLSVPDDLPGIRAGQADLEQLLLNLSTNARDAMSSGGRFSITACPVGPDVEVVEVVIKDNGCGIPPEHLGKVDKPFFTTKESGTGLGLSICRSIIWQMRGEMTVKSGPEEGTEVRLLLPTINGSRKESSE